MVHPGDYTATLALRPTASDDEDEQRVRVLRNTTTDRWASANALPSARSEIEIASVQREQASPRPVRPASWASSGLFNTLTCPG